MEIKTMNNRYIEVSNSIFTFTSQENNKVHGIDLPSLHIKDSTYWRDKKHFYIIRDPQSISYKVYAMEYSKDDKGNESYSSKDTGLGKFVGQRNDIYEVSDNNEIVWKNFTPEERDRVRSNHEAIFKKITNAIRDIITTLDRENDWGLNLEEIETEIYEYVKREYFSLAQKTYEYSWKRSW